MDQHGNSSYLGSDIGYMTQPAHLSKTLTVVCGHNDNAVLVVVLFFQESDECPECLVHLLDRGCVFVVESGMRFDFYLPAMQGERHSMHICGLGIEEDWAAGVFSLEQIVLEFVDDHAEFLLLPAGQPAA